jgi:hypothetical protein
MKFTAIVYDVSYQDLLDPPQYRIKGYSTDHRQTIIFLSKEFIPTSIAIEVEVKVKE